MCISDKNGMKKYDITDILLYPLVYSNLLIYSWMLGKIFRKDLQHIVNTSLQGNCRIQIFHILFALHILSGYNIGMIIKS